MYFRFLAGILLGSIGFATMADEIPRLAHSPTLSRTQIVFVYGGYLWSVPREGGRARQLTTGGHEAQPIFSPDGKCIAFNGQYDGNIDVYVIPSEGGEPKRLTWHPAADVAVGWTPDSKRVVFRSPREAYADFKRLYTVPVEGGWPDALPMWRGEEASFSPDGKQIAYVPNQKWQGSWKRYRGGQATPIYILRLSDLMLKKVPRENSNDSQPVWFGKTVYFLSDRDGPTTLFAYDPQSELVTRVVDNDGLDLKSVSAGPDELVYEQFGAIYLFHPGTRQSNKITIHIEGDLPANRPHFEKVADQIQHAGISPSGARAVFEARGEILTVPAEKGDVRNLTRTTTVAERDPAWSPDGKWIAYFSDESGEYELHLRDQSGLGPVKRINLGNPPSFFYGPTWSPDSKKIAYTDKRLNFWYVDMDKVLVVKVDTDRFEDPNLSLNMAWSPDSRWLTYSKFLENHLRAIFVYSLDSAKARQITDGLSDARYPVFAKDGKELLFAASTDMGLSASPLDLSSYQHPILRTMHAAVLRRGDPSPVERQSDEEKYQKPSNGLGLDQKKASDRNEEVGKVVIDFDSIERRTVPLPIKAANYVNVLEGKAGTLFLEEIPDVPRLNDPVGISISKVDWKTGKTEGFLPEVDRFSISANGEKALYRRAKRWYIAGTASAPKAGEGELNVSAMEVLVDPPAEWNQMYHEVWRIERDFFYDPNYHGLNLTEAEKKYAPYVRAVGGRADLNYLFSEMLGELTVGHLFISGGDVPAVKAVKGGLLGADYKIENGRYRFVRIYDGESWNPELHAPLTQPGADVKAGEYLLGISGIDVQPPLDLNRLLENTAGKQTRIRVAPSADGKDSRELTVVPLESELALRKRAWEEDSRRKVEGLSEGQVAYVHLPDTEEDGYLNFNRFYFGQVGKKAAIIDERYNRGGPMADYIIDALARPLRNCVKPREGEKFCSPVEQIYGPKTMIINEMAGSGGDALPWMFKQERLGPLVGTRTWGGLVGIWGYPLLLDGGRVTAPRAGVYGLHGSWEVENRGVAPDIEVENDPKSVSEGHDAQLEKAVQITLEALKQHPVEVPEHPPYSKYHKQ